MKLFPFFICLLVSSITFSQDNYKDVKIDFGFANTNGVKKIVVLEIMKSSDGYVMFRKDPIRGPGGWRYYLEKFDNNLNSKQVVDVSTQFENEGFIIKDMVKVGKNYILFTKKAEGSENKEELYYQIFDFETTKLEKPKVLYSRDVTSRKERIVYALQRSPDQELIMVYIENPAARDEIKTVDFLIFDENMEKVSSFENFEVNPGHRKDAVIDYAVGNLGEIYLLKQNRTGERNHEDFYEYQFIVIDEGEIDVQKLQVQNGFIKNISLTVVEDDKISAAGYYSNTSLLSTDGVFVFTGDAKSGLSTSVMSKEFSTEFITSEFTDRQKKKVEKKEERGVDYGMYNLEFRSIIYHDDNSFSIVGEIFWIERYTTTDANGNRTTRTVYHFADYISARIFEDEEIVFARYDKHETFGGVATYFNLNNNLAILETKQKREILDLDFENMTRKEIKPFKKDAIGITTIDPTGKQIASILFDNSLPENEELIPIQKIGYGTVKYKVAPSNQMELIRSVRYKDDRRALMRFRFE